jgi:hypothetical protein
MSNNSELNHKEIFFNRADVKKAERIVCDNCFEPIVFFLKDNDREFSMGLTTVLQCLEFAVKNGDLPKLPDSWLTDVENTYDVRFDRDISYYDYETYKKRNSLE